MQATAARGFHALQQLPDVTVQPQPVWQCWQVVWGSVPQQYGSALHTLVALKRLQHEISGMQQGATTAMSSIRRQPAGPSKRHCCSRRSSMWLP